MANRKIRLRKKEITDEELFFIVLPPRSRFFVRRRIQCARMLMEGATYADIQDELNCSTAFIANIVKRLKANGIIW